MKLLLSNCPSRVHKIFLTALFLSFVFLMLTINNSYCNPNEPLREIDLSSWSNATNAPVAEVSRILKIRVDDGSPNTVFRVMLLGPSSFGTPQNDLRLLPTYFQKSKIDLDEVEGPDCSFAEVMVLERTTSRGVVPEVITSARVEAASGNNLPRLDSPAFQKYTKYVLVTRDVPEVGRGNAWLESNAVKNSDDTLCDRDAIRSEMLKFAQ